MDGMDVLGWPLNSLSTMRARLESRNTVLVLHPLRPRFSRKAARRFKEKSSSV
jgi:hypothetical protein